MRALACLTLLTVATSAHAGDWPQWLGPHRDGTTSEIVKPWTDPPKVLWAIEVGEGHSSPIVKGDYVYLHYREGNNEVLGAISITSQGRAGHYETVVDVPFDSPFGIGPRATPALRPDGGVVGYGVTGEVVGIRPLPKDRDAFTGPNPIKDFHAAVPKFGVSASPLVNGNQVIVMVGGKNASLVAYDFGRTGMKVAWTALDDAASYASPIITEDAGRRQLIALTREAVVSLDPADGKLFWRHPFRDLMAESSSTPVRVGDLIVASSVTLGSVGLKLGNKDGKPTVTELWKNPALCCYFSTPVSVEDKYIYMVTGSFGAVLAGKPECALNCVEAATGKVLWTRPKVGKYHAALIRTGDNKLLMHSDTGELTMIDPDPKQYRELCTAKICGNTWAHPALSNGRLYVRDTKALTCLQLGK
jgi:outer membrane protein assembly factor BamB